MPEALDDKKYWRDRHNKLGQDLASVGIVSFSSSANALRYGIMTERYAKLLDELRIGPELDVLDAGSGLGYFSKFYATRGHRVTSVDISQTALDRISDPKVVAKRCLPLAQLEYDRVFPIVHCFDVLYHILDDDEWEQSLRSICRASSQYVFLSDRFFKHRPLISSAHVKMRTYKEQLRVLDSAGFAEVASTPLYVLAFRLLTYRLTGLMPAPAEFVERRLMPMVDRTGCKFLGSHHIKAFCRQG